MPQIPNIRTRDFRMNPVQFGAYGETTLAGLLMHESDVDLTGHPSLGVVSYDIFNPLTSVDPLQVSQPFVVWFAAFRWELPDTASNNIDVSLGGNAPTYNDLVLPAPLNNGNQETRGFRVFDQGVLLKRAGGGAAHQHWENASSTAGAIVPLSEPIRALVDASVAGAGPYTGKVFCRLLLLTLGETIPG